MPGRSGNPQPPPRGSQTTDACARARRCCSDPARTAMPCPSTRQQHALLLRSSRKRGCPAPTPLNGSALDGVGQFGAGPLLVPKPRGFRLGRHEPQRRAPMDWSHTVGHTRQAVYGRLAGRGSDGRGGAVCPPQAARRVDAPKPDSRPRCRACDNDARPTKLSSRSSTWCAAASAPRARRCSWTRCATTPSSRS